MSVVFMGGEMASFTPSGSGPIENATSSALFDGNFARCSIEIHGTDYVTTPVLGNLTDSYTHFFASSSSGVTDLTKYPFRWLDNGGVEVIRLAHRSAGVYGPGTGINTLDFEYSTDGISWTAVGSPATFNIDQTGGGCTIDARIKVNTTLGKLELFSAGNRVINATVNLSGISEISQVKFIGDTAGGFAGQINVSEVVVATASTIGYRLLTRYPAGNSATNTAWTGTYADVDEAVYADADKITSGTVGQVETYTVSGPTLPTGYFIKAIGIYARAHNDGTGPANLQLAVRSTGANYFSATQSLGIGYAAVGNIWETDPATTVTWDNAQVDAIEVGVKSVA